MFEFNEQEHILKMTPHVIKLVNYFKIKGITFEPKEGHLDNVIFRKDNIILKMSYHVFYRFSGISKIKKEVKNEIIWVDVDDDMFINVYIKSFIEYYFEQKIKNERTN